MSLNMDLNMGWTVKETGFDPERIAVNGNKFMIGNGRFGYRGTMEEFGKSGLAAVIPAGLYDQAAGRWREPVNLPNGLHTRIYAGGILLSVQEEGRMLEHSQQLDLQAAVHGRRTVFAAAGGSRVTFEAQRFASAERLDLLAAKCSLTAEEDCEIVIVTGIDGDVWDINGPHLEEWAGAETEGCLLMTARTQELGVNIAVAETTVFDFEHRQEIVGFPSEGSGERAEMAETAQTAQEAGAAEASGWPGSPGPGIYRRISFFCRAGETYSWTKYISMRWESGDSLPVAGQAVKCCLQAAKEGYDGLLEEQTACWNRSWEQADVRIEGDEEAQFALRYSLYQLLIIAPSDSERVSIPARGLSGQVYKGAVFWDTEMFMLPFFLLTRPELARNLMMYRVHTLPGAERKAEEYGFRGAFYAWESQDSGDDACTLFNVNDVFTGRPMRTYFRDKQIHISADVVHGIWQYYQHTGDESLLIEGGAEVIWEVARFYYSYAYYSASRQRYEILDVTGPDEYHERVNNNAFTNRMVKKALNIALQTEEWLREHAPRLHAAITGEGEADALEAVLADMNAANADSDNTAAGTSGGAGSPASGKAAAAVTISQIRELHDALYVPEPDGETSIIEQFDGYFRLEDVSLTGLKQRVLHPSEYWGGGSGLATTTQIIKQADVVLMLHLFQEEFTAAVKKANWDYYEPRTEHGSSLSPCVYALVAAATGSPDWAYPYFMRTATIDLTGESKQYVGDLYIGGTHPAANGGAWMAAVQGFAGIHLEAGHLHIRPALPSGWKAIAFSLNVLGKELQLRVSAEEVKVRFAGKGLSKPGAELKLSIFGVTYDLPAEGSELVVSVHPSFSAS